MGEIYQIAKSNNIPLDYVITKILSNSGGELQTYVQSKGETPLTDPTALALQAVLLRAQDVGTVATALDTTDEDALKTLESALQENIDSNSPEVANSPSIPVQAAIACALQFLSDTATANGQPNTMAGVTKAIQTGASKIRQQSAKTLANNDDDSDDDLNSDLSALIDSDPTTSDPTDSGAVAMTATPTSVSSQLAVIPGSVDASSLASLSPGASVPSIAVNASSLPKAGTSTTTGGVLNSIVSALGSISNIATQASSTATTLGKAVSGAGSNSIATYVQNNASTITMVIIIVIIIIVGSVMMKKK